MQILLPFANFKESEWIIRWIFDEIFFLPVSIESHDSDFYEFRYDESCLRIDNSFFKISSPFWLVSVGMKCPTIKHWDKVATDLDVDLVENSIPVLWGSAGFEMLNENYGDLKLDVIGSIFFMLSRYEEVVGTTRDQFDRFPASASLANKLNFLYRPIVDEYIEILWAAMKRVWPRLNKPEKMGRLIITCDVDDPYERWIKSPALLVQGVAGALLRRRSISHAIRRVRNAYFSRKGIYEYDPYWIFDSYMNMCEKYGHSVKFFFIARSGSTQFDCMYSLDEHRIQNLLSKISSRGHEIGMHGSFNTYHDRIALMEERRVLVAACENAGANPSVMENRQHYLRWDVSETPTHLDEAGFYYDSSGSYADMPGFRFGTSRSFPMWSWMHHKSLKLRQRPLIVMDGSIVYYLGLGYSEEALDLINKLKIRSLKYGGDFVLLWHNTMISTVEEERFFMRLIAD